MYGTRMRLGNLLKYLITLHWNANVSILKLSINLVKYFDEQHNAKDKQKSFIQTQLVPLR